MNIEMDDAYARPACAPPGVISAALRLYKHEAVRLRARFRSLVAGALLSNML